MSCGSGCVMFVMVVALAGCGGGDGSGGFEAAITAHGATVESHLAALAELGDNIENHFAQEPHAAVAASSTKIGFDRLTALFKDNPAYNALTIHESQLPLSAELTEPPVDLSWNHEEMLRAERAVNLQDPASAGADAGRLQAAVTNVGLADYAIIIRDEHIEPPALLAENQFRMGRYRGKALVVRLVDGEVLALVPFDASSSAELQIEVTEVAGGSDRFSKSDKRLSDDFATQVKRALVAALADVFADVDG